MYIQIQVPHWERMLSRVVGVSWNVVGVVRLSVVMSVVSDTIGLASACHSLSTIVQMAQWLRGAVLTASQSMWILSPSMLTMSLHQTRLVRSRILVTTQFFIPPWQLFIPRLVSLTQKFSVLLVQLLIVLVSIVEVKFAVTTNQPIHGEAEMTTYASWW
jgi:hypothetical protein